MSSPGWSCGYWLVLKYHHSLVFRAAVLLKANHSRFVFGHSLWPYRSGVGAGEKCWWTLWRGATEICMCCCLCPTGGHVSLCWHFQGGGERPQYQSSWGGCGWSRAFNWEKNWSHFPSGDDVWGKSGHGHLSWKSCLLVGFFNCISRSVEPLWSLELDTQKIGMTD